MKQLSFNNYEEYVAEQVRLNRTKLHHVWASRKELRTISSYIRSHLPNADRGICHGVRNGYEVEAFRQLLGIDVIGTDISDTASRFPNVVQWDFHEVKPEWVTRFDFVYSNSWDHSFDPERMLDSWVQSLKPRGCLFMPWGYGHDVVRGGDCFGGTFQELRTFISKKYSIEAVLRTFEPFARADSVTHALNRLLRLQPIHKRTQIIVVRRT